MPGEPQLIRTGFGLKAEVKAELGTIYSSRIVEHLRDSGYSLSIEGLTFCLAREFGFCYGVDRAVEYAYQSRRRFPDRRIYLTGEIIHNPHVNERLRRQGIEFLRAPGVSSGGLEVVTGDDVVIIPAFGLPVSDLDVLFQTGCTLVDTTCGSVLNVWKNVERYGREGFTSVIHGKHDHEETLATASRTTIVGGQFLVVRDMTETEQVAAFIESGGAEAAEFRTAFAAATGLGFEPERDLARIGLANQTTMLSTESLAIEARLRLAMERRWGTAALAERFRAFDTICSATQERQDAIEALCAEGVDLLLIVGGFNSSNTGHLLEIASQHTTAYHIEDADGLRGTDLLYHKPHGEEPTLLEKPWLVEGPLTVGLSSGASTPDNRVGEVVERLLELRGLDVTALALPPAAAPPTPA